MAKTKFFAIDAAGTTHTRSTERTYTHTVVTLPSYEGDLAFAASTEWDSKTARSNFRYYAAIAAGNDPHPARNWAAENADRYSAEEIAAAQTRADAENVKRLADAKARTDGHTIESYLAAEQAERIARVEKRKAEGYYSIWQNAGWCGRLDLAQTLAAKMAGSRHAKVEILPAEAR